jgi:hypothetical protein
MKGILMEEVFIPINGTDGKYEISNKGTVKSLYFHGRPRLQPKLLKPGLSHGYWTIVMSIDNVRTTGFIHRLIAEHFIPNPLDYQVVNHIDGNRKNNELNNLEWCSYSQNSQHGVDFISNRHGAKHCKAKFSEVDILKILIARFRNGQSAKEIASQMDASEATIINICAGRRYKKEYAKIMAMSNYGLKNAI